MQVFVKNQRCQLATVFALIISLVLAVAVVNASPLDFGHEPVDLHPRAVGGKYIGSRCTNDTQCYSENCMPGSDTVSRCRRQAAGGPCFEPNNCGSRQCGTDGRCTSSGTNGKCDVDADCSNTSAQCVGHRCKLVEGTACAKDGDCVSGLCESEVCRAPAQAPNSPCEVDSECLSGKCINVGFRQCTEPDGSFTACPGYGGQFCARYDLGHSCANNGECNEGLCKSGVCTASQDGDTCAEQYQCTGASQCGSDDGKCYTPTNGSVGPTQLCRADAQCRSGRCVTTLPLRTSYGGLTGTNRTLDAPECDYLNDGQSGCGSFADCTTGLCINSTCAAGPDGEDCQFNHNCVNVCSLSGVCYAPTDRQGPGQPCKEDSQCLSDSCTQGSVSRPALEGIYGYGSLGLLDTSCAPSYLGNACRSDSDCGQGSCKNSTCTGASIGDACTEDSQCPTGNCAPFNGDVSSNGTCQLAYGGQGCISDSQCYSKACTYYPGPPYCEGYDYCPGDDLCEPVKPGSSCRKSLDCTEGYLCDVDQICKPRDQVTNACDYSYDCNSGDVCINRVCAPPSSSSSTTTVDGNRSKAPTSSAASSPTGSTSFKTTTASTSKPKKTTTSTTSATRASHTSTTKGSTTEMKHTGTPSATHAA